MEKRVPVRRLFVLASLVALAATGPTYRYQLDGAHSNVTARVSYLGLGNKAARFPAMRGTIRISPERLEDIDLSVELDARMMTAGNDSDTAYLRGESFFDVAHYPFVSFNGHHMTMTSPVTARVEGSITARGITRPATLAVTFRDPPARATGHDPIQITGRTTINRREFGMTSYALVVGKKVDIRIDARLIPG